jgi:glucose-1-phosphate adenylyltransferase
VAAVPFAGKYRLIDFALSNCVNSEIYSVAILAQYAPLSLLGHVGRGDPWDLNRRDGGVMILQPYARQQSARWYEGTADALRQNLDVILGSGVERVVIVSSDVVCKMDYSWMLKAHRKAGVPATIAVGPAPYGECQRFGMVGVDGEGRVASFEEKPAETGADLAFMGTYVFDTAYLVRILQETPGSNLILDVLQARIRAGDPVLAYRFDGYWEDVGAVPEYFRAHQRLLGPDPAPDLYDPGWLIYARSVEMFPVHFDEAAVVKESLISNGAVIEGTVERSVLSPGVYVGPGAVVRESVIFGDTVIGPGATVERSIIDKNVIVGADARVGDLGARADRGSPELDGITLIGKWARVSDGGTASPGVAVPPGQPMAQEVFGREAEALRR